MVLVPESKVISALRENFRFLVLEVRKQVEDTRALLRDPTRKGIRKIGERDDYLDNLRSVIENKAFRLLAEHEADRPTTVLIRSINTSTSNLERIGDFAVNIVGQMRYLEDESLLNDFEPGQFFDTILETLDVLDDAVFGRDMSLALRICRSEFRIDELYGEVFRQIMDRLRAGDGPEDLVTTLFIFRYLERIGDALLNIGEAVIFGSLGEKLKISEYQALRETLESANVDLGDLDDADIEGIWESRSGCRIGTVHAHAEGPDARWVVFKEGRARKVAEEKDALELWAERLPGVAPKVFGYHEHGTRASILLEYLEGLTFQKIVLELDWQAVEKAFELVCDRITGVWESTLQSEPVRAAFFHQLQRRLRSVLSVHPEFDSSLHERVKSLTSLDEELEAPFSVLIHGDFNTDNLIIDMERPHVYMFDLHRTKQYDYLQDVSVFLVSNFRVPRFEPELRQRLDKVSRMFLGFAREFGKTHGDSTFDARLAAGLARSFMTSTRFALDEAFAGEMHNRFEALSSALEAHRGRPWSEFELDESLILYNR